MTDPVTPAASPQLGEFVRTYRADDRRRFSTAIGMLIVGALSALIGLPIFQARQEQISSQGGNPGSPFANAITGFPLFGGLLLVAFACWRLGHAIANRGERFDEYEGGFVHTRRGVADPVPWSEVSRVRRLGEARDGWRHTLGIDCRYVVQRRSGRTIRFNTQIESGDVLGTHIERASRPGSSG
ncbi:DUF6585 family protein [Plantactinospora endophytica]|uniref:Uncharacterized protein n=1 Tax=Plantactinospora endophytica TaxID=673535 RepID=A0ABQ4EAG0_9ACTN|nr:DUF6585 family protein [Plantactinospora endophytica]GIG91720.1 hypothetical protein Pen02_66560 [Plantactinospora endophytica]